MPQIQILSSKLNSEEIELVTKLINTYIKLFRQHGLWSESITAIIVAENLPDAIDSETNTDGPQPTRERETYGVANNIDVVENGEKFTKIFIDLIVIRSEYFKEILAHQILRSFSDEFLPDFLFDSTPYSYNSEIKDIIKYLTRCWVKRAKEFEIVKNLGFQIPDIPEAVHVHFDEFKRSIKQIHIRYQENEIPGELRFDAIETTSVFILRCLECYCKAGSITGLQDFQKPVQDIIHQVIHLAHQCPGEYDSDFTAIESNFERILELCYILLYWAEDGQKYNGITITKHPHLLFKDNYIDTELRFVAFLDILGFTNIIEEYDQNPTSNSLKQLKKSLDKAIEYAVEKIEERANSNNISPGNSLFYKNFKDLLEYRMFSDCFCISVPFINNREFALQFSSLALTVRIFQYFMLNEGLHIRGGISFGSYYSDKNMLFSGALVKAYKLESDEDGAKYPRVILDKEITNRLADENILKISMLGLKDALVIDSATDDYIFLNPLNLDKETELSIETIMNNFDSLPDELKTQVDNPELLHMIKQFANIFPNFLSGLPTTWNVKGIIQTVDKQAIRGFLLNQISLLDQRIQQTGNTKLESAKKKNEWMMQFLDWTEFGHHSDRFRTYWEN